MHFFKNFLSKLFAPLIFTILLSFSCGNINQPQKENAGVAVAEEQPSEKLNQPLPHEGAWYSLKKFVDGDTFWIDDSTSTGIKVRLIGMDTPESRNTRNKQKHPMGKEVADYVEQMLTGQRVRLELDVQHRDRYGRLLAYVFLEDGTHLNAHLLEKGYALLMTVPPNVKYADEFYRLQVEAREAELGLWK
jgi:micrococcal nuclease